MEIKGHVVKSTGSWYWVKNEAGRMYKCRTRGKLRLKGIKATNPIAVGDWVMIEPENEEKAIVKDILPRKNYMIRKSVNLAKQYQIIAANLDQVILMATLSHPKTFLRFIDRFLITAEAYDIPAAIIFNKVDLYNDELNDELEYLTHVYQDAGYAIFHASVTQKMGLEDLEQFLKNKTTLISGHSGVGKSSLLNHLVPAVGQKVKEVSKVHEQGQHTTTFAEMFDLPFGGEIIDTPGIKGFGLVDMTSAEIGDYFPEIFALKSQCKFHNCLHLQEPGCAVKQHVEDGGLPISRYESYVDFVTNPEDDDIYRKEI